MISLRTRLLNITGAAVLLFACDATVGVSTVKVAGIYELQSVAGTIGRLETPVGGRITLTIGHAAERRVTYQIDTTGTTREFVARGTYQLTDSSVELALREDGGRSVYVWRARADLLPDGSLRITYPRPADGTIVEVYQRR